MPMTYFALLLILSSTIFCMEDGAEKTINSLTHAMRALVKKPTIIPSLSAMVAQKANQKYLSDSRWAHVANSLLDVLNNLPTQTISRNDDISSQFWFTGKFHFEQETRKEMKQFVSPLSFTIIKQAIENRNKPKWAAVYRALRQKSYSLSYQCQKTVDASRLYFTMPNLFNDNCIACFYNRIAPEYRNFYRNFCGIFSIVLAPFFQDFSDHLQLLSKKDRLALFRHMIFSRTQLPLDSHTPYYRKLAALQLSAIKNQYPKTVLQEIDAAIHEETKHIPHHQVADFYESFLSTAIASENNIALNHFLQKTITVSNNTRYSQQIREIATIRDVPFQYTEKGFTINPKDDENKTT